MYTNLAEGDVVALRKICVDGIYDTFRSRIAGRRQGERVKWELVRYNARSKVVSHRAARLPVEGVAIRQAVVRIASRQKLVRWVPGNGGRGKLQMVEGTGKEKDVVEYLVMQKKCEGWEEGDWMVWGTTQETGLNDVLGWEKTYLE